MNQEHPDMFVLDIELQRIAALIKPLPESIGPSDTFRQRMKKQLLALRSVTPPNAAGRAA
jgi:hypothetical protein